MKRSLLSTLFVVCCTVALFAQPNGWKYMVPITLTNGNAVPLTNYTVTLNVDALQYSDTPTGSTPGGLLPSGNDMRFGNDCAGNSLLPFYFDDGFTASHSNTVYVKVDSIPAKGTKVIFLFFGNIYADYDGRSAAAFTGPYYGLNRTIATGLSTQRTSSGAPLGAMYGWQFAMNATVYVESLGIYSPFTATIPVNINDGSNVLGVSQVNAIANTWSFAKVAPFKLNNGNDYDVIARMPGDTNYYFKAGTSPSNLAGGTQISPRVEYIVRDGGVNASALPSPDYTTYPLYANYTGPTTGEQGVRGLTNFIYYLKNLSSFTVGVVYGPINSGGGITVNPNNITVCTGASGTMTSQAGGITAGYQWQASTNGGFTWLNLSNSTTYSGVNSSTLTISHVTPSMSGYAYRVAVSSICGAGTSDFATLTVNNATPIVPLASIAGPNPACALVNDLYTLTTNISSGTTQWFVNGALQAGANSGTFAFRPVNGDMVQAIVTVPASGALGCYTAAQAASNSMQLVVTTNIVPTDTTVAGATSVCDSTQVDFLAHTNVVGGTFQWRVNGVIDPAFTGNGYTYIPANGDQVTSTVLTPNNGCYSLLSATSKPAVVTVIPPVTPIISISAPSNVTVGNAVNVHATVLNYGTGYSIKWIVNGDSVFTSYNVSDYSYNKAIGTDQIKARLYATPSAGTCFSPGFSNVLLVGTATGINNVQNLNGISAYPNPFNDQVTVKGVKDGETVAVYDVMGRQVSQTYIIGKNATEQEVSIHKLAPGSYFLKVYFADGTVKASIAMKKL